MHLVLPASQNFRQHFYRQCPDRKAHDAHCGERFSSHGVDIGECVCRGDLPEEIRIVDDWREEIDGLDQCQRIGQPENPRIIEGLATNEDSGIGSRVQRREGAREVTRTQFGGSTGAARELGQTKSLFAKVSHGCSIRGTLDI
jgi:hypothetical protein